MFCSSNTSNGPMFPAILKRVGFWLKSVFHATMTITPASSNGPALASLPTWTRGAQVLTWRAPGMIGPATIEDEIILRGVKHFIVVFREEPDVIYGLRDEGQIWAPGSVPPEISRGASFI